jgi:hypothetical protein
MTSEASATTALGDSQSRQAGQDKNLKRYLLWGGLLTVLLAALIWSAATLMPRGGAPAFAKPEAIEATYPQLLDRLAKVALPGVYASEIAGNDRLVAAPEVLEATVGTVDSRTVIGNKRLTYQSRSFVFPKQPAIGRPVVNQYAYVLNDGRAVVVLSFEAKVLDAAGQERLIQVLFDPAALEQRLLAKKAE